MVGGDAIGRQIVRLALAVVLDVVVEPGIAGTGGHGQIAVEGEGIAGLHGEVVELVVPDGVQLSVGPLELGTDSSVILPVST